MAKASKGDLSTYRKGVPILQIGRQQKMETM
jgi:hypothetical protein